MNQSPKSYNQLKRTFLKTARAELLNGLEQCTPGQQLLFKRMYANGNLKTPIADVVKKIPEKKLDWALQQVSRTLVKNTSSTT